MTPSPEMTSPLLDVARAAVELAAGKDASPSAYHMHAILFHGSLGAALIEASERDAEVRRLAREIDVALCGEAGAAPQASLCDLVGSARDLRRKLIEASEEIGRLREALVTLDRLLAFSQVSHATREVARSALRRPGVT